jgi:hypothetical protein
MNQKTVYQIDTSGAFIGETLADESPLEPGVWLMPARTVETPPPECPDNKIQQWNGVAWQLIARAPAPTPQEVALAKLKTFMAANPDVAEFLNQGGV